MTKKNNHVSCVFQTPNDQTLVTRALHFTIRSQKHAIACCQHKHQLRVLAGLVHVDSFCGSRKYPMGHAAMPVLYG